ncbi:hypothetical protein [Paracoccus mutanolyticus]
MGLHRRPEMRPVRRCRGKRPSKASCNLEGRNHRAEHGVAGIDVALAREARFGDTGGGFRRLIQIVFGISIAFAASSFFLSFFSFGGGALV